MGSGESEIVGGTGAKDQDGGAVCACVREEDRSVDVVVMRLKWLYSVPLKYNNT